MNTSKKIIGLLPSLLLVLISCNKQTEVKPVYKVIRQAVFASGYVEQEDEYVIAATADGTIQELNIREGDSITAGDPLVKLKSDLPRTQLQEAHLIYADAMKNTASGSPQLTQIQTKINLAKSQLQQDKNNLQRYTDLKELNAISQLEFENAELQYKTSQTNLEVLQKSYIETKNALQLNADRSLQQVKAQQVSLAEYAIKADKSGVILEILKKKGELVRKGEVIARIGSGKHILKLFVAENDITKLSIGQQALIQMNNYPDTTFSAEITRILPSFDQTEQSYIAEAIFINPPPLLLSGTQLQANIKQSGTKRALVIPADAVLRGKYVQLKNEEEREIKTGMKIGQWVEVKSGITEKDILLLPKGNSAKKGVTMPGTE